MIQLPDWRSEKESITFVDRPLKLYPQDVLNTFRKLKNDGETEEFHLKEFLAENFFPDPSDDKSRTIMTCSRHFWPWIHLRKSCSDSQATSSIVALSFLVILL